MKNNRYNVYLLFLFVGDEVHAEIAWGMSGPYGGQVLNKQTNKQKMYRQINN